MDVRPLNEQSAREVVRGIKQGTFSAESVTRACLDRIAEREPALRAWAFLDPDLALRQARERDRVKVKGPLHGLPIGVKDIFDTFDMPTDMGSPIYRNNRTATDASCVAQVRAAGAVILGKTITCEFAGLTPNITRNPHDPERTPGGSSSGSAAAVADRMVHVAFGTQTGGSILRPASFCGVVGYKPTYNIISRGGMKLAAESRDTIGLFARTVEDVDLVASVLTGREPATFHGNLPRIALCRTHLWDKASADSKHAIEDAAKRLDVTREATLPPEFDALAEARTVINPFERARALAHEWSTNAPLISPGLTAQIEKGLSIPHARYVASLKKMKDCRDLIPGIFGNADILLAPCVTGEAPKGLESTGETMFQEFWTVLHVPTVTIPTHRGSNGLPIGIQLIARHYEDESLLAFAQAIFARLGANA